MDFNSTVKGSMLEGFYPAGWDFVKIDECCSHAPEAISERQSFWNKDFNIDECTTLGEFDVKMGHEIANEIKKAKENNARIEWCIQTSNYHMHRVVTDADVSRQGLRGRNCRLLCKLAAGKPLP